MQVTNGERVVIGVSGGLDSTHALIVAAKACDTLHLPRRNILAFTMPGFATSEGTKANAWALMNALGVTGEEIDIKPAALRMLQDLGLEVPPLPRLALNPLRQMGQLLFQPPNVRGWVGGRSWINSSTLAVRRQLVQQLFSPLREETFTADEQRALREARATGRTKFVVPEEWPAVEPFAKSDDPWTALARRLLGDTRGVRVGALFASQFGVSAAALTHLRNAAAVICQTPDYQLC